MGWFGPGVSPGGVPLLCSLPEGDSCVRVAPVWVGVDVHVSSSTEKPGQVIKLERPGQVVEHPPGLTRPLDYGKEGLAVNATRTCTIDGCDRPHRARGYCPTHWGRWRRNGDPMADRPVATLGGPVEDRFWSKVRPTGFCWEWTGHLYPSGYGGFHVVEQERTAHRVAYELLVGPIPDGLHLDHLCRNRKCVNPDHLEPVTSRENTLRGYSLAAQAARSNVCAHGHEYTAENTRFTRGYRECRECDATKNRARRARLAQEANQ